MSEAHNNLGIILFAVGEHARAESAFREAIRIQPDYADAHGNLGNLLSGTDFPEARYHFEIALRLRPDDAATRYNYAMALGRARHFDEAQRELEARLRADDSRTPTSFWETCWWPRDKRRLRSRTIASQQ
jgi:tetratricopeptide (TPR) repeat protein